MTEGFIKIATITKPFGLKGQVKARTEGETIKKLSLPKEIFLKTNTHLQSYTLRHRFSQKDCFVLTLDRIETIEKAETLRSVEVYLPEKHLPKTAKDEFYFYQLVGLHPKDSGVVLTDYRVVEVMDNPAHPILVIQGKEGEILIPFINRFIGDVDLMEKSIQVLDWEDWFAV
ncbi:MAG: ribosome maturation factor RimM [Spirochaetota bacterium]